MKGFAKIQKRIDEELNQRLGPLGFPRRSKARDDYFIKLTASGYQGVQFEIRDYGTIATRMTLLLRFDVVAKSRDLCDIPTADWMDLRQVILAEKVRPTFDCSYERLAGLPDQSFETIESEAEIPGLCDLWLDRFRQVGLPYFGKYGDLSVIVKMVRTDDPDLIYLDPIEGMRYVTGAALIHALDGREALLKYVKNHQSKYVGMDREMVDRLIAASEKLKESKV